MGMFVGLFRFILIGMTLINVFHGSSGIPFYSQYLEAKSDYEWALIQINQLGSSIYGTKKWRIAIIKELKRK